MTASSTTLADALDKLVALAESALAGEVAQVIDGPPTVELQDDIVIIGFSADRLAVEGEQEIASLGRSRQEAYEIVCLSSTFSGDTGFSVLRQRAVGYVNVFRDALAGDPTLGRTVLKVQFGSQIALDQAKVEGGISATIEFTLRVTAMT